MNIYTLELPNKCLRCGECCQSEVFCSDQEWLVIQNYIVQNSIYYNLNSSSCPFFRNNFCYIYEVRPLMCRLYGWSRLLPCEKMKSNFIDIDLDLELRRDFAKQLLYKEDLFLRNRLWH